MKSIINIDSQSYILHQECKDPLSKNAEIIVPRTAEWFNNQAEALAHEDIFCEDISEDAHIFNIVLPGQDLSLPGNYSFENSVDTVIKALRILLDIQKKKLIQGIGICTGGCILTEAILQTPKLVRLPLALINSAADSPWNREGGIAKFEGKGYLTRLDKPALLKNGPMPKWIIQKYPWLIKQILCGGKSDYPLESTTTFEGQRAMAKYNPNITQWLAPDFGNSPDPNSPYYAEFLRRIRKL